jgi:cellulose biosynthesis protein BcsQ
MSGGEPPRVVSRTAAVVGAVGGAGATRLTLELGAALARDDHRVAVFDAAVDTQGLAGHVPGRLGVEATDLLLEDVRPAEAMTRVDTAAGELHACPVRAPFATVAETKTTAAARRFDEAIREAAGAFEYVLVDVPPVGSNLAVAGVTAVDRVAGLAPATDRGADGARRLRETLADLGTGADRLVANRTADPPEWADHAVPESDRTDPSVVPVADEESGPFPAAVAEVAAALFEVDLDAEYSADGFL